MSSREGNKTIQEFEFTIKLQVSGDYLQKHDVKSIMKVLSDSGLYSRYNWMPVVKSTKNKKVNQCAICQENMKKNQLVLMTQCNHCFHKKCISKWYGKQDFTPTCPMCRAEQNSNYKHENVYHVHTCYNINEDNFLELERTIQREGSTYIRFHDI